MNVADFDFDLPQELIAQEPPSERGTSRLLVVPRNGPIEGRTANADFNHLPSYLRPGDLLVVNDTRVFPARLLGKRMPSGGAVECLVIAREPHPDPHTGREDERRPRFLALMHPGQKLKPGARVVFERAGARLEGEVIARHFHGRRTIQFSIESGQDMSSLIDRIGHIPLPPYIRRADGPEDRERYQTVYACARGSIAAPTAGLHFSAPLLEALEARGVQRISVTLHVGYGTFKPVRVDRVEDHVVDPEQVVVSETAAATLTAARREGRRIIAVGTTTARALESVEIDDDGCVRAMNGATDLFIRPGHEFRLVDGLITNFHLPRSSLLMLVAAFAGRERVLAAYREAMERQYRFYSYGDAMIVL
jgi:S-adenosylmethionine:tRNA ribosyltransferase-isomerase